MPGYYINVFENLHIENKKEKNEIKYIEYAKLCPYLYFRNLYLFRKKS